MRVVVVVWMRLRILEGVVWEGREKEEGREERAERAVVVIEAAGVSAESEASLCASRLRPKASEKTFPPSMGESETYPQFSEKCAVCRRQYLVSEMRGE